MEKHHMKNHFENRNQRSKKPHHLSDKAYQIKLYQEKVHRVMLRNDINIIWL